MIANTEDEQKCDQKNEQGDDFTKEMRNGRLLSFLEVKISDITIDQRDDERRA